MHAMLTGRPEVSRNWPIHDGHLGVIPVGRPATGSAAIGKLKGVRIMASSALLERGSSAAAPYAPYSSPSPGWQPGQYPAGSPAAANWCVLPRCNVEFEKCTGGFKIRCRCEDEVACGTLQNLCRMLSDGLCSCSCCQNGICIFQCNLAFGNCKVEYTKDGCCISCISGDKAFSAILQSCCEALSTCGESGCCCYISFNNTPVCCGTGG
jgi:hypothetical protein